MTRLLSMILLLSAGTVAHAQSQSQTSGFNYTFIDLGYYEGEIEDEDGDGFGVDGSLALTDQLHAFAGYSNVEPDRFSADASSTEVGVGFNTPLSPSTDLILRGAYVRSEVDFGPFEAEEDGFGVGAGIRTWIADGLELNGGLDYVDFGGNDDDTAIRLGLVYSVSNAIAFGLSGSWTDDPDSSIFGVNARFYLGR